MAIEMPSIQPKAPLPEVAMAHEEKVGTDLVASNGSNNNIQAYEARRIDLRTILGLLVRIQ